MDVYAVVIIDHSYTQYQMCVDDTCKDLSGNDHGNDGRIIDGHTCSSHNTKVSSPYIYARVY